MFDLIPGDSSEGSVETLALDFDGVLSHHGGEQPLPEVLAWLQGWSTAIGNEMIFIFSNKPTPERAKWFEENLPGVRFISGVRKKPFTEGLELISKLSGTPACKILMADDRLLTGCLCAVLAGAKPYYIRKPYIDLSQKTFKELFFMTLRSCERVFVRLLPQ